MTKHANRRLILTNSSEFHERQMKKVAISAIQHELGLEDESWTLFLPEAPTIDDVRTACMTAAKIARALIVAKVGLDKEAQKELLHTLLEVIDTGEGL